jgi:hypothetical protein
MDGKPYTASQPLVKHLDAQIKAYNWACNLHGEPSAARCGERLSKPHRMEMLLLFWNKGRFV